MVGLLIEADINMRLPLKNAATLLFLFIGFSYCIKVVGCHQLVSCSEAQTCQQCYSIPAAGCAWCSSPTTLYRNRCFAPSNDTASDNYCPTSYTFNKQSSITLDELALTDDNQISVRKATVRLRAGDTRSFQVKVRPAENFPLDLYMIVDLSFSLVDDLKTIKDISSDIADTIRNISTRFQIGFGTFVDKLIFPFTSPFALTTPFRVPISRDESVPSACKGSVCSAPISYVHNVNLTNVSSSFIQGFDDLEISTNADNPEGTLDAMAQAILCRDVVGWRENARKIIVVITDAPVHVAGDGVNGGILTQAPDDCRTRYDPDRGFYTYVDNAKHDYPSIEQIRTISKANLVSPVFAVLEEITEYYKSLASMLTGVSPQVVTIQDGSKDIIQALEMAYENIVSTVQLAYIVADGDVLSITNTVSCPDGTVVNSDGVSCSNVTTNDTVIFNINVTLHNCTNEVTGNNSRTVSVNIPGYGRFEIVVEGICRCDCEASGLRGPNLCSGNGTQACGVCECDPGWMGENCNCRTDETETLQCPTGVNGDECSGRGNCLCGECQCRVSDDYTVSTGNTDTLYTIDSKQIAGLAILLNKQPEVYGTTCECDNYYCPRNDSGFVCSGNQGNCTCSGACECASVEYGNLPYTGTSCACNRAFCYNQSIPYSDRLRPCNGNGDCNPCDMDAPCNCLPGFLPPFCLPSALTLRSCFSSGSFERQCVQCIADNDNFRTACESCFNPSSSSVYDRISNDTDNLPGSIVDTTTMCSFVTSDPICTYEYYIALGAESTSNDLKQIIHVEATDCFPLLWWHITIILLAILLIFGIIFLIIARIIILILDYKEVKHFDRSVAETDLTKNVNPLYTSPEVKYENVTFGRDF